MPIFINNRGKLQEIPEVHIHIERDIQKLVEDNMNSIFGIELITKEFELNGLRVDSLGFVRDSNSFIIFEYKREKNFSVIDQGYAYLALLLNNKAEFILVYNENSKTVLRKHDVDWTQSRVIFVSPSFTTYQRKAIEFKDLPIELWEVKLYANNIILFNQIQSPEKSESITKVSQKSELVRSVSKEVVVYNEDDHIKDSNPPMRELYGELKEAILSIAPDVTVKPKARYISFVHKTNFVDIVVRKSNLSLFLNVRKGSLNDPKNITRDVSNVGHWGNGDYEITFNNPADIGYILTLVRQSYEKN